MRRFVWRILEDLTLATLFMTRFPVSAFASPPSRRPAEALWAMPLAGLFAGAASGAVWVSGLWLGLGAGISSIFALAVLAALTGAIHDDGFADFWDGLGSSGPKARRIEIMRDPRIGTYGALALIFLYLFLYSVLVDTASGTAAASRTTQILLIDGVWLMGIMAAASMQARAAVTIPYILMRPAGDDGLALAFGKPSPVQLLLTALWPVIASVFLFAWLGLAMIVGAVAGGIVISVLALRQIGGYTGDVLGASIMMSFAGALLAVRAMLE